MKQNSRTNHAKQIMSSPPLLLLFLFPSHYLHIFSKPKNGWMEWEKMIKTKQVKHKNRSKKKDFHFFLIILLRAKMVQVIGHWA